MVLMINSFMIDYHKDDIFTSEHQTSKSWQTKRRQMILTWILMIKLRTSPAASPFWKWRCSQDYWASLTFKYSQLWNIALPTSLLRKETMANNAGETLCRIKIGKSNKHLTWETGQYRCYNHQIYPTMLSFWDFTFLYLTRKLLTTLLAAGWKIYVGQSVWCWSSFEWSDFYFW